LRGWPPFLLAGAALAVGSLCSIHRLRDWRVPGRALALGVYGLFGFHFLLFVALRLAPPVEANLVNYLWPLLIVVLAPLVLPASLRRCTCCVLTSFAGAVLAVAAIGAGWPGLCASARLAFVWASYSLYTRASRR
jgi:drug/metabolite transporter (DMT)-like permease